MSSATTNEPQIRCILVTPERTVLDTPVDFVAIPRYDGELGILPGRAPLIGRLGFGELRTRSKDIVHRYFIDGGFAQLRDNVVTILTSRALPSLQLNVATAAQELEQARSRAARTDSEQAEKARAIQRARAQLRLAEQPA